MIQMPIRVQCARRGTLLVAFLRALRASFTWISTHLTGDLPWQAPHGLDGAATKRAQRSLSPRIENVRAPSLLLVMGLRVAVEDTSLNRKIFPGISETV